MAVIHSVSEFLDSVGLGDQFWLADPGASVYSGPFVIVSFCKGPSGALGVRVIDQALFRSSGFEVRPEEYEVADLVNGAHRCIVAEPSGWTPGRP